MVIKNIKVGIIGHTGRLGKPLTEIMQKHPFAEIVYTESRQDGKKGDLSAADAVFLALPYGESQKYLPGLERKKIIDLSIDHRSDPGWTYGLPEIFPEKISQADKIANPGCYATSIILGLYPVRSKVKNAFIASTSGISGAGREVAGRDNFHVYEPGVTHPQLVEIKKATGFENIWFVPQRIDTADKGIVSTIFLQGSGLNNLSRYYAETYRRSPFIRIKNEIDTCNVIGANFCDIQAVESSGGAIIVVALDNLIKGGSGQAVQNFNLMHGLKEDAGLLF